MNFEPLDITLDIAKFSDALVRYKEPHRKYHNLEHIELMFIGLSVMYDWLVANNYNQHEIDMIKAAVVYHDVVYDIGSRSNEVDSANLFVKDAEENGWFCKEDIKCIFNAILTTDTVDYMHNCSELKYDSRQYRIASVLCDLDLYPFTVDGKNYSKLADSVVEEYTGLARGKITMPFFIGNVRFLLNYLERDNIFNTTYARKNWHNKAVRNILSRFSHMSTLLR